MSRARLPIFLAICSVTMLVWVPSASAAPDMCTAGDIQWPGVTTDPQGVEATHLLAKVGGQWVEPANVCVAVTVTGGAMEVSVFNTVDGGFPETHLPPDTPISLGLDQPADIVVQTMLGRWRDGVVVANGSETVVQGRTAPFVYYPSAYPGPLDCAEEPVVWPSTFAGFATRAPLDGSGNPMATPLDGMFFESNAVQYGIPTVKFDPTTGLPNGMEIGVQGCGDGDARTLEGYFDGFVPVGTLNYLQLADHTVRDLRLVVGNTEVVDTLTGNPLTSAFGPMRPQRVVLDPIPGVVLPASEGPGFAGVQLETAFSFAD